MQSSENREEEEGRLGRELTLCPSPRGLQSPQPGRLQGSAGRSRARQGPVPGTAGLRELQRAQSVLPTVGWLLPLLRR